MNVAVVHHLPSGGALRVLAEWLKRTEHGPVTVYTREAHVHAFVGGLPQATEVVEVPLHAGGGAADELRRLWTSPADGRRLAARIEAGGHDVVFAWASRLTQALDVLPALTTPSLFYAPEPLRSAYEPRELIPVPDDWRGAITRAGVNPIELRRRQLDRRYLRGAQRVVTHSAFTRSTLRATYGVESDVVLLGVDAEDFAPGTRDGAPYVLAVGALHPLKGHDLVIDAIAALPRPRPRLVLVGDRGEWAADLERRATAGGVELDLRQGVPFAEVRDLYRRAAVVACGQVREPFGLVPLEAMACRTPVVAVDEGGFRETITDGVTGLLVPRDASAMAAAIGRILDDDTLAEALGEAGLRDVRDRWTWERTTAGFDALLREQAATGPRRL